MMLSGRVEQRAPYLLLAFCLTIGAIFRWYHLDRQTFWYDEMHTRLWATGQSWVELRPTVPAVETSIPELQGHLALPPGRGPRDVIRSILRDDPQHTPLYYLVAHGWIRVFGDSVWTLRALSVLIGLLTLPCVYWLCRELRLSLRSAQLATALASVSPFFVIYSQEARQYGLWGAIVLVASALLLRAARSGSLRDWMLYAIALVAGLYTHLLFVNVIVAHAAFLFVAYVKPKARSDDGRSVAAPFLGVATMAMLALLPWIALLLANLTQAERNLKWSAGRVSVPRLFGMWGFNYSSVFVDADHSLPFVERYDLSLYLDYGFRVLALALIAAAMLFVLRRVSTRQRAFIVSLVIVPFLALALPDLALGGIRSGGGHRYLFPSYIGVLLAVSCLFGEGVANGSRWMRFRTPVLGALVSAGLVSLVIHAKADMWWTKPVGYYLPRVAHIVNQSPNPLLISPVSVNLFSVGALLEPTAHVFPVRSVDSIAVPDKYSTIFVLDPSEELVTRLRSDRRFTVVPIDPKAQLWELRRQAPP